METTKKDLEYYRKNAEEDYMQVPISVLRYITEMEQALRTHDVRQRCLSVINTIAPTTELDEQVKGWIDDLDFVEIVMEAELQFDCMIEDGETRVDDFEKVSDLVDWLASKVA